jgi:hypothetical protein
LSSGILTGSLFLVPVAFHAALSTASLSNIHGKIKERTWVRILLASSTLLGVVFAIMVIIPPVFDSIMVSLISGVLLYIIVREFLPQREKGEPVFFVIGVVLFSTLAFLLPRGSG